MTQKRAGRPNLDVSATEGTAPLLNVRVTGAVFAELDAAARRRGITRSEAMRQALDDYLADDSMPVAQ